MRQQAECTVDIKLEELPKKAKWAQRLRLHLKQSKSGLDEEKCWKGLELTSEMISVESKRSLENDSRYLNNAAKLERILTPALFKESLIGAWKLHTDDESMDSDDEEYYADEGNEDAAAYTFFEHATYEVH
jgi:hypothetical protein